MTDKPDYAEWKLLFEKVQLLRDSNNFTNVTFVSQQTQSLPDDDVPAPGTADRYALDATID